MVFGLVIQPFEVVAGGLTLAVLLVLQVLIGLRKIRFAPRIHLKVHRWIAYAMLAIVAVHATLALVWVYGWQIG